MTHFSVLCWSFLAALFAVLFMDVLLPDPVRAGETVEQPAPAAVTQIQPGLGIPVVDGRLALGTWQGIYLWEHRRRGRVRSLVVHVSS